MEYNDMSIGQLRDLLKAECAIYNVTGNPSVWHRNRIAMLTTLVKEREMAIVQTRNNLYEQQAKYTKWALIVAAVFTVVFFAALAYLSI